jgi:hypothetical protein
MPRDTECLTGFDQFTIFSQQYLKLFTTVSSQKFAVIKVGGAILRDHLDDLCRSLL